MKNLLPILLGTLLGAGLTLSFVRYTSADHSGDSDQANIIKVAYEEPWALFEEKKLLKKLNDSGKPWLPFLNNATMSCGIYRLEAGAEDGQQPHKLDEVYYTLSGKARFRVNGAEMEVSPGTILFVEAGAEHQFYEVSQDLELLVFFSKASAAQDK